MLNATGIDVVPDVNAITAIATDGPVTNLTTSRAAVVIVVPYAPKTSRRFKRKTAGRRDVTPSGTS